MRGPLEGVPKQSADKWLALCDITRHETRLVATIEGAFIFGSLSDKELPVTLHPVATVLVAVLVLLMGRRLRHLIPVLEKYNIPDPITGGIIAAVAFGLLEVYIDYQITFDVTMKPLLLLMFFAAIGLSANLGLLKRGGRRLLPFVLALIPLLLLQNGLGVLLSRVLDMHPLMGLLGGSITLIGGHGTGAAYAEQFAEVNNLNSIMELAMTSATIGLVLGGVTGGPLAHWLIRRYALASADGRVAAPEPEDDSDHEKITPGKFCFVLAGVLGAVVAGQWVAGLLGGSAVTLPGFLWCMLFGVLFRNVGHLCGLRLNDDAIELMSSINLSLFLSITMMTLNIVSVFTLAGPLLLILFCQMLLVVAYGAFVVYRAVGNDYEAAVMSAAFCGFTLGATATAIANMQAVTEHYGPAPQAFVVVPLVGAFLVDLLNALVLTLFMLLPGMGG